MIGVKYFYLDDTPFRSRVSQAYSRSGVCIDG